MLRIGEPFVLRVSVPVTSNVERLTHAARSTSATGRKPTAADRVGLGAIARSRLRSGHLTTWRRDLEATLLTVHHTRTVNVRMPVPHDVGDALLLRVFDFVRISV